jgi:hypothetical protein
LRQEDCEFEDSRGYIARPCLKKNEKKKEKKNKKEKERKRATSTKNSVGLWEPRAPH